jgi:hypothetical protein
MDTLKALNVKEVKERCESETQKYLRREAHTTEFCYELFRRFFEDRCDPVIGMLHTIYRPLVSNWVRNHKYFHRIDVPSDEIVFDSLSHFIFSLKRHPFSDFATIAALLVYWRKCVHTIIMTEWRKRERIALRTDDRLECVEENDFDRDIIAKAVWERIRLLLTDPNDLLLARLVFVYNMKIRHIVKEYPAIWKDANEVRVDKQRIKRCLRKDERLLTLLQSMEE